jgi:2-methylcitrate dehydratase PrpD
VVLSLIEQVAARTLRPIPATLVEAARLNLLDWIACAAGGKRGAVADAAAKLQEPFPQSLALLANVLEMDDVHRTAVLHPGPSVWPAVLEVASDQTTLGELLIAGVRGYEAVVCVGASLDARHYAFYHNTATAGPFGAAAGAGAVLGLTQEQMADALALAGSTTGGLWQTRLEPRSMAKQMHVAHAARTGAWAARLAQAGLTGPRQVLEGPLGLYAATCAAPRTAEITDAGDGWRLAEVSFKPWGACRHAHPTIDAMLGFLQRYGVPEGPILVEAYQDAVTFCDKPNPKTTIEAKFSLQHAVAVVLDRGVPELTDFEPARFNAPHIAALRGRVRVQAASDLSARYPSHWGARIQADGQMLEITDTLGDPERPVTPGDLVGKARALFGWGGVAADLQEVLLALVLHGRLEQPVAALRDALARL